MPVPCSSAAIVSRVGRRYPMFGVKFNKIADMGFFGTYRE